MSFLLDKRAADTEELLATHPRRHRRIHEIFSELEDLDTPGDDEKADGARVSSVQQ